MKPAPTFPLIRRLSARVTPMLARTPLSPNSITIVAMVCGLTAAACFAVGTWEWAMSGACLLVACYVLDNCDGEIARLKGMTTELGKALDTLVDWLVHAAFFIGLGHGVASTSGETLWVWLGWIAAAGGTLNFWLGRWRAARVRTTCGGIPDAPEESPPPVSLQEKLIFAFRELSRADFCFIVLALALIDEAWLLLPAGAIGAQVYWMTGLLAEADRYHV